MWALSSEQWNHFDVSAESGSIAPLQDLAKHEKEKAKIAAETVKVPNHIAK